MRRAGSRQAASTPTHTRPDQKRRTAGEEVRSKLPPLSPGMRTEEWASPPRLHAPSGRSEAAAADAKEAERTRAARRSPPPPPRAPPRRCLCVSQLAGRLGPQRLCDAYPRRPCRSLRPFQVPSPCVASVYRVKCVSTWCLQ